MPDSLNGQGRHRLSPAQRTMLTRLSEAPYGELYIRGAGHRTYEILRRRGFVERTMEGWGRVTPAGREAIR